MSERRLIPYGGDRTLYIPEALTDPSSFPIDESFSNILTRILNPQRKEIRERALELLKENTEDNKDFPWLFMGVPTSAASALQMINYYPENLDHLTLVPKEGSTWFWDSGSKALSKASKGIATMLSCAETAEIATRVFMVASRMLSDQAPKKKNKYHALYLLSSGKHHSDSMAFHIAITFIESSKSKTALTSFSSHLKLFQCLKTSVPAEALGQIFTDDNKPNVPNAQSPDALTNIVLTQWQQVATTKTEITASSKIVPLSEGKRSDEDRVAAIVDVVMEDLRANANKVLPTLEI